LRIYWNYQELLEEVNRRSQDVRSLGHSLDGSPIVVAKGGGEKLPAVFITAGSHSTEHAGVSAAVELLDRLDTNHAVYVIPTRDPIGMNGFAHALSLGLGRAPTLDSYDDVEALLRNSGDVLFEEGDCLLTLIGDYGYALTRPAEGRCAQISFMDRLREVGSEVLEPLYGRRVYMNPAQPGIDGAGDFGRAYTLIIGFDGDILHLNRFHDTAWAPVESRVTRNLMTAVDPGISFDLHESAQMDDRFWLSARKQMDAENQRWEERAAHETIQAIADFGATLANTQDAPSQWFTETEQAVFWLDATKRGEGLNLMDYASRRHGMAFGTEMGMYGSFEQRVELALITVRTAVAVFEERYA
tara:strand:+ start:2239 stop:3309 length:1071 start_codon:yes stop_codon:yes gene_type:complete